MARETTPEDPHQISDELTFHLGKLNATDPPDLLVIVLELVLHATIGLLYKLAAADLRNKINEL